MMEIMYPTGKFAICANCGESIQEMHGDMSLAPAWYHENGDPYCANAPKAQPMRTT